MLRTGWLRKGRKIGGFKKGGIRKVLAVKAENHCGG